MGRWRSLFVCVVVVVGCRSGKPEVSGDRADASPGEVSLRDEHLAHVDVEPAKLDVRGTVFITTGRVAYNDDALARVAAPVAGRIESIAARIGDDVKRGQTLAVIQSPQVASAAADLAQDRSASPSNGLASRSRPRWIRRSPASRFGRARSS